MEVGAWGDDEDGVSAEPMGCAAAAGSGGGQTSGSDSENSSGCESGSESESESDGDAAESTESDTEGELQSGARLTTEDVLRKLEWSHGSNMDRTNAVQPVKAERRKVMSPQTLWRLSHGRRAGRQSTSLSHHDWARLTCEDIGYMSDEVRSTAAAWVERPWVLRGTSAARARSRLPRASSCWTRARRTPRARPFRSVDRC
jgi:hypothetical protein